MVYDASAVRTGEGFLLVYSITSRPSFDEISVFHQQILRVSVAGRLGPSHSCKLIVFVVTGQGQGLFPGRRDRQQDRSGSRTTGTPGRSVLHMVDWSWPACLLVALLACLAVVEGLQLARSFGSTQMETSAKARINVDESFHELVRAIRKFNKVRSRSILLFLADYIR